MAVNSKKKVAFYTLGCKVNQYDTQAMIEQFTDKGYEIVDFGSVADVYVINTCTVTNEGDRKCRQVIRKAHRMNPDAIIAVTGCYAQRTPEEVLAIPGVKIVAGTHNRRQIVDMVEYVEKSGDSLNAVKDITGINKFEETPIKRYEMKTRAVVKIQEGCNRFCSYCIIPYVRGSTRSRDPQKVYEEIERLVNAGFKEIVLTGINVALYGSDLNETSLLDLIRDLHSVEGLKRIRLGSLDLAFFDNRFFDMVCDLPKLCPHYHISLQSGSNQTLRRMNRNYTTEDFRDIVYKLRKRIPDVAITTDIIVGFPGETEKEFQETLTFVEEIGFSRIHVFQYSPREGTPAAKLPDQVDKKTKEARSQILISLGKEIQCHYLQSFVGRIKEVLFENEIKHAKMWYEGYTDNYMKVIAAGNNDLKGKIVPVYLKEVKEDYMIGDIDTTLVGVED